MVPERKLNTGVQYARHVIVLQACAVLIGQSPEQLQTGQDRGMSHLMPATLSDEGSAG